MIASSRSNVLMDKSGTLAIVGALDDVLVWNIKKEVIVKRCTSDSEVTRLALHPNTDNVAAGYASGLIKLWEGSINDTFESNEALVTLSGHKSAVSALCFNAASSLLVSGSADTDVIIWDMINEQGLYRLRGHRDMVTSCIILEALNILITSSKDTTVKVGYLS